MNLGNFKPILLGNIHPMLTEEDGPYKLFFYLTDDEGHVLYQLLDFYGNEMGSSSEVRAVSFQDVNNDNLKDIIIIAEYITGAGAEGAIPSPSRQNIFATK
ncbi:hypothetical protein H8B09_19185 [Paenibacillus sp. PR3]|uniref:Spore coat protein n=1 Tax=Paenibacillus terricola TaxID=2763503 RepID=A0ABR8N376_9BACL|nr:hypothetical protein [Paenibacillus terricola]MBD3920899.1 hypothetical protein [Paenibacillus terricola]